MADNLAVTPGSGATVGADDVGGVLYQRVKLGLGADGTAVDAVAGAGSVDSGTQRVTLANNDPLVAALKAEDAASADGDKGFVQLAVRKATPANTSGTDGDYEPLQVSGGRLWTSATVDSPLPTGTNTVGSVGLSTQLDPVNDALRAHQVVGRLVDPSGNALTVKRARATVTTATAAQIVAAVTGKQILVLGYSLQSQGANAPAFNFQDNAGTPVVLSRTWKLDATGAGGPNGVVARPTPMGCGVDPTTAGQALMGKMDATGSVVVEVTYVEL